METDKSRLSIRYRINVVYRLSLETSYKCQGKDKTKLTMPNSQNEFNEAAFQEMLFTSSGNANN